MYRHISPVTQAKINALLEELRSWPPGETKATLRQLAKQFDLDVFVVDRLARAEGFPVPAGVQGSEEEVEEPVDPNATTLDLDPDEVRAALEEPDPDPEWADKDTAVWRKKPTGEWERVE